MGQLRIPKGIAALDGRTCGFFIFTLVKIYFIYVAGFSMGGTLRNVFRLNKSSGYNKTSWPKTQTADWSVPNDLIGARK